MRFCINKSVEAHGNLNHVKFNSWYALALIFLAWSKPCETILIPISCCARQTTISLAVSPGVPRPMLAGLLAAHRQEEPATQLLLREVAGSEVPAHLTGGECDIAITCNLRIAADWIATYLCDDELAVAVSAGSPSHARGEATLDSLRAQPVCIWPPEAREKLFAETLDEKDDVADVSATSSFELLALLVAAGYCLGIAPQSRIAQARSWGILARPLADERKMLSTALLRLPGHCSPVVERFAERAGRIATSRRPGYSGLLRRV